MDKNQGGRPTKLNDELRERIIECAAAGYTDKEIAAELEISRTTLHKYKNEDHTLRDDMLEARGKTYVPAAEKSLLKRVKGFRYTETTKEFEYKRHPIFGTVEKVLVGEKKVSKYVPPSDSLIRYVLSTWDPTWREGRVAPVELDEGIQGVIILPKKLSVEEWKQQQNEQTE